VAGAPVTIPVQVQLSGPLETIAAHHLELARTAETEIGLLAHRLGIKDAIKVEISVSNSPRPLRVVVNGRAVPFPADLVSRLSLENAAAGGTGADGFGETIARDCLDAYASNGTHTPEDVASLVVAMVADRPAALIGDGDLPVVAEAASGPRAVSVALAALLDLGVVPRGTAHLADILGQNSGRAEDAIEAAFTALQGREIEIVVSDAYRSVLTREGTAAPKLVHETEIDPRAHQLFRLLEQRLVVEWGIVPPDLVWTTDAAMADGCIAVTINDRRSWSHRGLAADELLVLGAGRAELTAAGVEAKRTFPNPANPWLELSVVDASAEDRLVDLQVAPPAGFAALVVYREVSRNAHRLLGSEQTLHLLHDLGSRAPELVRLVLRNYSLTEITLCLRALVQEHIPPRLLPVILESLARQVASSRGREERFESIRRALHDYIDQRFGRGNQARTFFDTSQALAARVAAPRRDERVDEQVRDAVWAALARHSVAAARAAVYAPERARATLHRILEPELPDVVVVLRTDFRPAPEPKATIDL
jgi:flagellar biosynthesis component FlhA